MMKLKNIFTILYFSLSFPAALFSQLEKSNTFEDKGFVSSTFQQGGDIFFRFDD